MNFIGYFPPLLVKVNSVRQCHPLAKLGTSSYNLPPSAKRLLTACAFSSQAGLGCDRITCKQDYMAKLLKQVNAIITVHHLQLD